MFAKVFEHQQFVLPQRINTLIEARRKQTQTVSLANADGCFTPFIVNVFTNKMIKYN